METIYSYTDYRTFLKSHYSEKREQNDSFSYGLWAKKLEMSSTAVLTNIINGKRNPGPQLQEKFVRYFKFNDDEQEYFSDLVKLHKVKGDPRLSLALKEKMSRKKIKGNFQFLDDTTFSAISSWHYYAIREMVALPQFQEDYDWIAKNLQFKVTPREIKKALEDLLELGLIERGENGELQSNDTLLKTSEDVASEGLRRFHEQMISNGKVSIREVPVNERDISGRTINIDEKNLPELKKLIREFRDKVSELFEESEYGTRTYQLNLQLFPLTRSKK